MASLILALSTTLIATAWRDSSRNARSLARSLMARVIQNAAERTLAHVLPADQVAARVAGLVRSGVLRLGEVSRAERIFVTEMRTHRQIAMINLGDTRGNFLMVKRFTVASSISGHRVQFRNPGRGASALRPLSPTLPDGVQGLLLADRGFPFGGPAGYRPVIAAQPTRWTVPVGSLSTKVISRGRSPYVLWKYRDAHLGLRAISWSPKPVYDPRPRPWFRLARKNRRRVWTDVYLFFTDRRPGLAAAAPVLGPDGALRGALSVELALYRLSEFLAARRVGRRGRLALIDAKGKVIAFSDPALVRKPRKASGGGPAPSGSLYSVREHPDPVLRKSVADLLQTAGTLRPNRPVLSNVRAAGRRWFTMFQALSGAQAPRWTVGVMVDEEAVLGPIRENRRRSLFIMVGACGVAFLLVLWLARSVSRPLALLAQETDRIRNLDLQGDVAVRSRIREVHRMAAAVQRMKVGLRSFEKYVPRDLVRQLVRSGQEAELHGQRREVTVLFTDVAGFTALSEKADPAELVAHLNRYFGEAAGELRHHGATLDKFIGDAIMAFWNAPSPQPDHAERACRAALGLQARLAECNRQWAEAGLPVLPTRIGIHTGVVVVGNIGSEERLSYTLVGDAVNLASRLEGTNKLYGTWTLASEDTYQRVSQVVVGRVLDVVAVKGRSQGVRVYELRGLRVQASVLDLEVESVAARALDHYLAQRWDEAERLWMRVRELLGGTDRASELLAARCAELRSNPPLRSWSGTYRAPTK